jgi:hypothetical protein
MDQGSLVMFFGSPPGLPVVGVVGVVLSSSGGGESLVRSLFVFLPEDVEDSYDQPAERVDFLDFPEPGNRMRVPDSLMRVVHGDPRETGTIPVVLFLMDGKVAAIADPRTGRKSTSVKVVRIDVSDLGASGSEVVGRAVERHELD